MPVLSKKTVILLCLAIGLWLATFWQALLGAARIWYISEIFSHGFFVLPGALYLIWRLREQVDVSQVRPAYLAVPALFVFLVAGLFGWLGDIQVIQHISAFTSLIALAVLAVGWRASLTLWFPLLFILFSIPIGEELIPTLQKVTADLSVWMLGLTGLPVFNSGLYIEIPQGRFVVAEACSGIRFFIGSLVFGAIYAHLTYRSLRFQVLFWVIAALIPILANALRVFGIVLAGYYSDMTVAVGADHLIYGWVFFAIVLFMLMGVGSLLKRFESEPKQKPFKRSAPETKTLDMFDRGLSVGCVAMVCVLVWKVALSMSIDDQRSEANTQALHAVFDQQVLSGWEPVYSGYSEKLTGQIAASGAYPVSIAAYIYDRDGAFSEMVSAQNRIFNKDNWSRRASFSFRGEQITVPLSEIVSASGVKRLVARVFIVEDRVLTSPVKTKLFQTWQKLFGGTGAGIALLVSAPSASAAEADNTASHDIVSAIETLLVPSKKVFSR